MLLDPTRTMLIEIVDYGSTKKVIPARPLYRQRLKDLEDELIELRYKRSQLENENKKLKHVTSS